MLAGLVRSLNKRGLRRTLRAARFGAQCRFAVHGKRGLEIGGPSEMFHRMVPVYPVVRSLDNCVFSRQTIWEGTRNDGDSFDFYPGKSGRNRVMDAVDLAGVRDAEYDFILSCHSLEHIANPIKALRNWRRVAPNCLVLILPYYRETFDHRRSVTTLQHMIEDFERKIGEDDATHVKEVLELSDLSRLSLPKGRTLDQMKELANPLENFSNRSIHHHVFDLSNSIELLNYSGYRVLARQVMDASIFLLATAS
jgi:hypothetical protein